jgi:serine/threonine protein kinase
MSRKLEDFYDVMDDAVLGSGVSSVVKVCTDKAGIEYAVKIISKQGSGIDEEKFIEEIRLLQKLGHPNIMTMEDVFEDEENIYIVTELMCGGELFDRILEKKFFSERDAAMYTQKILEAVSYLHSHGVVHRDLKPDNILFTELGKEGELKIVDFGFALDLMSNKRMMQAQAQLGTQGYAAPEIFSQSSYDEKCDVWSIGVITYIMLAGLPPFIEYDESMSSPFWVYVNQMKKNPEMELQFPPKLFKKISLQAQNFIKQCLEKNPLRRARSTDLLSHSWFKVARTDVLDRGSRRKYMSMTMVSGKKTPFNFEEAKKLYMQKDEEGLNKLIARTSTTAGSMTMKFPRYTAMNFSKRRSTGLTRSVTETSMTDAPIPEDDSEKVLTRPSSHRDLDALTPSKKKPSD